ncbi:MAG: M20/M25/M40 family metallo-hydrolase [Gemmatimonadaceae bacterium]|nr:M20/M25/M40 family metallo-hydrolase [Gemmatimonadaceae bacterium]
MRAAHVSRARTPGARVVSARGVSAQVVRVLVAAVCCAPVTLAAQPTPWTVTTAAPAGFDRTLAQRASLAHLTALIGLNTQNPPGNELLTAQYFDKVFSAIPGVERDVLPVANGRANFVARLRATNPTKRPVLIMGHMDVVGVDSAKWKTPPFTATTVQEGNVEYLYGRGAIDDKGMLATATAAMQQLALRRDQLDRDVIFMATAAEEGGPEVGIVEGAGAAQRNHPSLLRAFGAHRAGSGDEAGHAARLRSRRVESANRRRRRGAVTRAVAQRCVAHGTVTHADERRHPQQRHSQRRQRHVQRARTAQRRCARHRAAVQSGGG